MHQSHKELILKKKNHIESCDENMYFFWNNNFFNYSLILNRLISESHILSYTFLQLSYVVNYDLLSIIFI